VLEALGPAALERRELADAIRAAAEHLGFDGEDGPRFSCTTRGVDVLPASIEQTAYRIAGEALHNVARHAGATRCDVSLTGGDGSLHVRISDDGVGLTGRGRAGVGLNSIRLRAKAAGGSFTVSSKEAATGTVVHVQLPLGVEP
jgi:signal transduction histidine kinase